MRLCIVALLLALSILQVQAREAAPLAQDEATEKRLVEISTELRCLVCQNESLSASQAELANDLRREIRTLIKDGKNDKEIMDFMVSRYGDFVRYRPPLKGSTVLLWFGPALLLAGGLGALLLTLRRRNVAIDATPLSADELRQAKRLLNAARTTQADVDAANRVRAAFTAEVDAALERFSVLALPTMADAPPSLDQAADTSRLVNMTALVRPFNLSGHPAIAIPLPARSGFPVSLQLVAAKGRDELLCAVARHVASRLQ